MQAEVVISEEVIDERIAQDNQGFYTASFLLWKLQAVVKLISRNGEINLEIPDDIERKPHLLEKINLFKAYASEIKFERYVSNWCKHIGAIVVPWNGRGGQIHLYLLDDGFLSKGVPTVPFLHYKERSNFYLYWVFGLEKEFRILKGKIHLHVISARDLDNENTIMSVKRMIASEHESSGNYIERTSMLAFSLRENCQYGKDIAGAPDLATNEPDWFKRQIPKWKM